MDPQQQQQIAGMMAGFMGIAFFLFILIAAFAIFLFWRILTKAGLAGPLALLVLVPGVGWIIVVCILAFSEWRVVPAPQYGGGLQPYPPPPTSYPPSNYNPPPPPPSA